MSDFSIAIIGGGPAGATLARLIDVSISYGDPSLKQLFFNI